MYIYIYIYIYLSGNKDINMEELLNSMRAVIWNISELNIVLIFYILISL